MTTTINASTSAGLVQTADTSGILALQTANTTAVTIDGSQNVGIGTTPSAWGSGSTAIQNAGKGVIWQYGGTNIYVGQNYYFNGTNRIYTSTAEATEYQQGAGFHRWYYAPSGTAGNTVSLTEAMRIDNTGNLGIGTTSPGAKLQVAAPNSGVIVSGGSGTSANLYLAANGNTAGSTSFDVLQGGDSNGYIYNRANGTINFGTNNTERMRIDSSGSLLVGTTTTLAGPAAGTIQNLTAVSTNSFYTKNSNATPYGIEVQYSGAAPNGTGSPFLECFDTSTTRVVFRSNGGLANYSANNVNLSDQREKKDIELAPSYLSKICQIPVKTFLFNDQTDTDLNLGAIAQDVQAVCPELVMESNWAGKGEPEKMRFSIYQTDLQYALMKSIQELKAMVDSIQSEFDAYKATHP